VLVSWIYGSRKFLDNIQEMIPLPAGVRIYWNIMWTFIVPVIVAAIVILKWYTYKPMRYKQQKT
jgi:SNF family Na+-dependent transporter